MSWILPLFYNIRFYVLVFSLALSAGILVWVNGNVPDQAAKTTLLAQIYSLTALSYLYFALLAGPLTRVLTALPFRGRYLKARRAIGVSAFYFALLHIRFAFFDVLGGFQGLFSLDGKYILAIFASSTAFLILFLMAATSFDAIIRKLTFPKWKMLHRFVYLAGVLILFHAMIIGSHFQNISSSVPVIVFIGVVVLLTLHAIGLYRKYLHK